jgi:hypothetical protein
LFLSSFIECQLPKIGNLIKTFSSSNYELVIKPLFQCLLYFFFLHFLSFLWKSSFSARCPIYKSNGRANAIAYQLEPATFSCRGLLTSLKKSLCRNPWSWSKNRWLITWSKSYLWHFLPRESTTGEIMDWGGTQEC